MNVSRATQKIAIRDKRLAICYLSGLALFYYLDIFPHQGGVVQPPAKQHIDKKDLVNL